MKEQELPMKLEIPSQAQEAMAKMSPDDRRELMNAFITAIQKGELFESSEPVNLRELKEKEPEVYLKLMDAMGHYGL
jgi:hypothetical protein